MNLAIRAKLFVANKLPRRRLKPLEKQLVSTHRNHRLYSMAVHLSLVSLSLMFIWLRVKWSPAVLFLASTWYLPAVHVPVLSANINCSLIFFPLSTSQCLILIGPPLFIAVVPFMPSTLLQVTTIIISLAYIMYYARAQASIYTL